MKSSCYSILVFCAAHLAAARYLRNQIANVKSPLDVRSVASAPVDDEDGGVPWSNFHVLNEHQGADVDSSLADDVVNVDAVDSRIDGSAAEERAEDAFVGNEVDGEEIEDLVDSTLISAAQVPVAGGESDLDTLLDENDTFVGLEKQVNDADNEEDDLFNSGAVLESTPTAQTDQVVTSEFEPMDGDAEIDAIVDDGFQGDPTFDNEDDDEKQVLVGKDGDVQVDPFPDGVDPTDSSEMDGFEV
ncbi:hypothetical protein H310_00998 [Aphanomyces invadans]|uniref:RxLR effector protein n=1 Tax=Aphanomyces invadans TaxID=157072 RepID=A0A024US40_9STRA|nr:hypothetical protein H310_00998 [Aphanomyces invadans]ETW08413.1 hypothetical protein H310_00998 [Aphanomyces invadans]|eukprot:XP_008862218.1 hypothetical protein H310_00998 [Aphanomyces invadans]